MQGLEEIYNSLTNMIKNIIFNVKKCFHLTFLMLIFSAFLKCGPVMTYYTSNEKEIGNIQYFPEFDKVLDTTIYNSGENKIYGVRYRIKK